MQFYYVGTYMEFDGHEIDTDQYFYELQKYYTGN